MTALVLQHVEIERPYHIANALAAAGIPLEIRRLWEGALVPDDPSSYQAIVVMGGPMSAYSDTSFATRQAELALLNMALDAGVPTLGVCLGAQLIAVAAGGKARPGDGLEIGWGPVRLTADTAKDPLFEGLSGSISVLHWHGDTVDLPVGSILLASSDQYPNQAFRLSPVAWGLQFHLEVTAEAVDHFCVTFRHEAQAAGGIDSIRAATPQALAEIGPVRSAIFDRFASLACSVTSRRSAPKPTQHDKNTA